MEMTNPDKCAKIRHKAPQQGKHKQPLTSPKQHNQDNATGEDKPSAEPCNLNQPGVICEPFNIYVRTV